MTLASLSTFAELQALLPGDVILVGEAIPQKFQHDWSGLPAVRPAALALPRSTADVSTILSWCSRHAIPVVPQGGLTGLAGGAQPIAQGLALNLERMAAIEELDADMATVTVQAGARLEAIQQAADGAGMALMLDLGARGSCAIGGNIATNAGGNRVIRYGMAREHVLGLEFVLADGTVVTALNKMLKNNAGYDVKQTMIGSEGTLGIITRAVLRLQPKPQTRCTALCSCPTYDDVLAMLRRARQALGPALTAFEVMWPGFYETMRAGLPGLRSPLAHTGGIHVIIEASGFDGDRDRERFEQLLSGMIEGAIIADAVIAVSDNQTLDLWAIRESVSEYGRVLGRVIAFDIGLPNRAIGTFVDAVEVALRRRWSDAKVLCYGHIGDSNLHVVVNIPSTGAKQPVHDVDDLVYEMVAAAGGTISAEHGIGVLKKPYLSRSRTPNELETMNRLKQAFDPKRILNPGKVIG